MLYPEDYYQWSDAEKRQQSEAGKKLVHDLSTLKNGEVYTIQPGNYRFDADEYLLLTNLSNVEINGYGATLWFTSTPRNGFRFTHCDHVILRGVTLDRDGLPWLQGTISAVDDTSIQFSLEDYFVSIYQAQAPEREFRMMFLLPDGSAEYDCKDWIVKNSEIDSPAPGILKLTMTERIKEHIEKQIRHPQVGDRIVLGMREGQSMLLSCACGNMVYEDITIYACNAFAFAEFDFGEGGNVYRRCRLCRRPGTDRLLACAADGFHSLSQRRGPVLEDCEISWTMDDLLNIHGFFSAILEQTASDELLIVTPYGTSMIPGGVVSVYSAPYGEEISDAHVLYCEKLENTGEEGRKRLLDVYQTRFGLDFNEFGLMDIWRLKLDVPMHVQPGDFLGNYERCGAGAKISKCYFHDSHVRGILVKSKDAVIEDNRIENVSLSGIILKPEFYWLEGPMPRNVTIRNNSVKNCSRVFSDTPPICMMCGCCPPPIDRITGTRNFHSITITGNCIDGSNAGPAMCIANTVDADIRDNSCSNTWANANAAGSILYSKRIDSESIVLSQKQLSDLDDFRQDMIVL